MARKHKVIPKRVIERLRPGVYVDRYTGVSIVRAGRREWEVRANPRMGVFLLWNIAGEDTLFMRLGGFGTLSEAKGCHYEAMTAHGRRWQLLLLPMVSAGSIVDVVGHGSMTVRDRIDASKVPDYPLFFEDDPLLYGDEAFDT